MTMDYKTQHAYETLKYHQSWAICRKLFQLNILLLNKIQQMLVVGHVFKESEFINLSTN